MNTLTDYIKTKCKACSPTDTYYNYSINLPNVDIRLSVAHYKRIFKDTLTNTHAEETTTFHIESKNFNLQSELASDAILYPMSRTPKNVQTFTKYPLDMEKVIKLAMTLDHIAKHPKDGYSDKALKDIMLNSFYSLFYNTSISKKFHNSGLIDIMDMKVEGQKISNYELPPKLNIKTLINAYSNKELNLNKLIKETLIALKKEGVRAIEDDEREI